MKPVDVSGLVDENIGTRFVTFAKDQPEYDPLPAVVYPDGKILTEWMFTEDERDAIARGENVRLWIWTFGRALQPVSLEVTDEHTL